MIPLFKQIQHYKSDPIESLFDRLAADVNPAKIDLGIGVYRDYSGKVPVMQAVRRAEQQLFERDLSKSYLSPLGNTAYCEDIEKLTLGVVIIRFCVKAELCQRKHRVQVAHYGPGLNWLIA